MKNNTPRVRYLAAAISLAMAQLASAQQATDKKSDEPLNLDTVVVTGTSQAGSKMKTSVSVSTLSSDQIEKSGASSTAELLRSIPGVRSESSGGEGNANITMRGVPISAGGARYTQFQENGLPVLLLGDFNFVTGDMFSRADYSVDHVEVVRGGSGSTQSSNSPAGIINFVKKTGEQQGGAIGVSAGLGYKSNRVDFEYGSPITTDSRFYVGGYYRRGEGARKTDGVTMENGGQISGNFTQKLGGNSFLRVDAKFLDDKTPTLLPVPVNYNPATKTISEIPGIDPRTTTPYANGLQPVPNWGVKDNGSHSINDGLTVKSNSIGGELNYELGAGFVINDKLKIASNSGIFSGLLANSSYPFVPADRFNQLFLGAKFNNLGLSVNDLKLSKGFAIDQDTKLTLAGGLFYAKQKLDIDWEIGGFTVENKNNNAAQLTPYTSFFKHQIDIDYTQTAPYLSVAYDVGALSLDASVRFDRQTAKGSWSGGDTGFAVYPVDYKSDYTGKSAGANYQLNKDLAVFARYSEGAAFNSDRILFTSTATCAPNCFKGATLPVNTVKQFEGGVKWRAGSFNSFVTLFDAKTKETNYDLTTGVSTANSYDAKGVEVEVGYRIAGFRLGGGFTYTDAKITGEAPGTPPASSKIGLTPNRQASFVYQLTPSYSVGPVSFGANIVGTSDSKDAQKTTREVTLPAFVVVNPYLTYQITDQFQVNLNVNNLFNTIGYTEMNDDGGRMAARSINGRTVRAGLKYSF